MRLSKDKNVSRARIKIGGVKSNATLDAPRDFLARHCIDEKPLYPVYVCMFAKSNKKSYSTIITAFHYISNRTPFNSKSGTPMTDVFMMSTQETSLASLKLVRKFHQLIQV